MNNTILKNFNFQSTAFLFLLFFAFMHGSAFMFADSYNHMSNVDVQTYVGLSNFDFDQHPVRRYRIIIPLLAAGVRYILHPLFTAMAPNDFPGDFSTIMSFMVVNSVFMAIYAVLLFRIVQHYIGKQNILPAFVGVACVLTCRWTPLFTGTALVDSLFLMMIALFCLGILKRSVWMILLAIYIGPWAKESFIFFVPLLAFLPRKMWTKMVINLVVSGIVVFGYRYLFDASIGSDMAQSIGKDLSHFELIPQSLSRLFSFHGLYELFSIGGFWNVFVLIGLAHSPERRYILENVGLFWFFWVVIVVFQALLSTELARMFYMLTPLYAILVSLTFDRMQSISSKIES